MISSFFQKIIPTYLWDFLRNPRSCAEELHKKRDRFLDPLSVKPIKH